MKKRIKKKKKNRLFALFFKYLFYGFFSFLLYFNIIPYLNKIFKLNYFSRKFFILLQHIFKKFNIFFL